MNTKKVVFFKYIIRIIYYTFSLSGSPRTKKRRGRNLKKLKTRKIRGKKERRKKIKIKPRRKIK